MIEEALANELNLLRKLVEINTTVTSDSRMGYAECSEMIRLEAQRMGLGTEVLDGRHVTIDGESRLNVVVSLEGTSDVNLIYVTHLDVVPADPEKWKIPPFQLRVTKDRAYGRGAADDKSNIVAAMSAMAELAQGEPEVNINLLVTVDERLSLLCVVLLTCLESSVFDLYCTPGSWGGSARSASRRPVVFSLYSGPSLSNPLLVVSLPSGAE